MNNAKMSDVDLDARVQSLEDALVGAPGNRSILQTLLNVMERHQPGPQVKGRHAECQRTLSELFPRGETFAALADPARSEETVRALLAHLRAHGIGLGVRMTQLHLGAFHWVGGVYGACDERLAMFKQAGAISKLCVDCFKVQILTPGVDGLMQIIGVLAGLRLPRDNARKCMVETRGAVRFPYKGYIYCQSEEEAEDCRRLFLAAAEEAGATRLIAGLSHGCSEYGLAHPEFKYDLDGAHRSFQRPDAWDAVEKKWFAERPISPPPIMGFRRDFMSLRDVMCLQTWLAYAVIIEDQAAPVFLADAPIAPPRPFFDLVSGQAEGRKAEACEIARRLTSDLE